MSKDMENLEIAKLLRDIAAVYEILGENRFKTIAYDRAADSIEHLTSEAKDLWDEGKLKDIPGVGEAMSDYLDELFRTGKVKHFESVMKKVPEGVFPLLLVPGIGPKKAYKLVKTFRLNDAKTVVADLIKIAQAHKIAPLVGFGEKSENLILEGISAYQKGQIKENRMVLPEADYMAEEIIKYLHKSPLTVRADKLGSLRRQVSTIGDIDIAVASHQGDKVLDYFLKYPHKKIIERGPGGASIRLNNGRQVDLRVQNPDSYGGMLQYFTGSKNHNIKLREFGLSKKLSLSEYGIKKLATGKVTPYKTEEEFYLALGLPWIPPEIREDRGEIEAAQMHNLPKLVELSDIKGDLHLHTEFDLEPSHDLGRSPVEDYLDTAAKLGYEYIGVSDHNPSINNHTESQIVEIMKKRREFYEKHLSDWKNRRNRHMGLFIMLEVDIQPDGKLALPEDAFKYVDGVIVSVHSSFRQDPLTITKRIISGLSAHPKVRILGHPTARLLGNREGVDAKWPEIFETAAKHQIALEINSFPERLDLPDNLIFDARRLGIKFCINTDSHEVSQMEMMRYGVSVARRGWATKGDIINALDYNGFKEWLIK